MLLTNRIVDLNRRGGLYMETFMCLSLQFTRCPQNAWFVYQDFYQEPTDTRRKERLDWCSLDTSYLIHFYWAHSPTLIWNALDRLNIAHKLNVIASIDPRTYYYTTLLMYTCVIEQNDEGILNVESWIIHCVILRIYNVRKQYTVIVVSLKCLSPLSPIT